MADKLLQESVQVQTRFGQIHALHIGEPEATPVIFMHGFPGSHFQATLFVPFLKKLGIRVIAPDRPGYGFSDPMERPSLYNFMASLETLLEKVRADKFFVVGVSGGNPAAVCTAVHFSPRVLALASICGLAPYNEIPEAFSPAFKGLLKAVQWTPRLGLQKAGEFALRHFSPDQRYEAMQRGLAEIDVKTLNEPDMKNMILTSMRQARRQGARGIVFDGKTYSSPWPYDVADVTAPHFAYHGVLDKVLSHKMTEGVARVAPRAKVKIFPEEGHYSLPFFHAEEILREVVNSQAVKQTATAATV